jgi:hypothetical protein
MHDPKCYELAREFLADEPELNTEPNAIRIADAIQRAIEDEITDLRVQMVSEVDE